MTDYNCYGKDFVPAAKKRRTGRKSKPLKLSLKNQCFLQPCSCFNVTADEKQIEKSSKGSIPKNTNRSTSWALCTFQDWLIQRNRQAPNGETFPSDLFEKPYPLSVLNDCLQRFVLEAKRADGTEYSPKTLYQLLCGLLQHSREC